MATVGQLAAAFRGSGNLSKRAEYRRYQQLCDGLAEHDTAPGYVDDDAAVRVLVSLHTTLQPSEWDKLTPFERLPFVERAAAALGLIDAEGGEVTGRQPGAPMAATTIRVLEKYDEGLTKAPQILEWVPEIAGKNREQQLGNIRQITSRYRTNRDEKP